MKQLIEEPKLWLHFCAHGKTASLQHLLQPQGLLEEPAIVGLRLTAARFL
jgi:hypothetical protein